jgi:hypothetical protein
MRDEGLNLGPADGTGAPARLVDSAGRPGEADSLEGRAGTLLRTIKPPAALSPARLSHVRARLEDSIRPAPAAHRRARAVVWVLAGALILFCSGMVAAARGWAPKWPLLSALLPHPAADSAPEPTRHHARVRPVRATTEAPAAPPATDPLPIPATTAIEPPPATNAPPRRKPAAVAESALLERAVMALRQQGNPTGALSLLDRYEARFPSGVLVPEAARLRIDALLLAGRRGPALDRLNRLALSDGARDLELGLIRGELRAASGDCARAVADFDHVLALASDRSMKRRAQAGRAACVGSASPDQGL